MFDINLKAIKVSKRIKEYSDIKELICRAFPKSEQIPVWLLKALARRKSVSFLAYYDNGSFCGISYTASTDKMVFVLYLAVNDKVRSKGYGTAILEYLKELYADKPISLNIEAVDTNADNYAERVKRFEFYKKNGFHDTEHKITDNGEIYSILSNADEFNIDDYRSVLKRFSFGFYVPMVVRNKN